MTQKEMPSQLFQRETRDLPSVQQYYLNLVEGTSTGPEITVFTAILVDRFIQKMNFLVPIHFLKLIAVATFVALKVHSEVEIIDFEDFSLIAGLNLSTLFSLEKEFLEHIDFKVIVERKLYLEYLQEMGYYELGCLGEQDEGQIIKNVVSGNQRTRK